MCYFLMRLKEGKWVCRFIPCLNPGDSSSMRRKKCMMFLLFVLLASGLPWEPPRCQSTASGEQTVSVKRLILTDGSFERISQYAIQGDRVRYFSTERYVWEELPLALVDWQATEKYAREAVDSSSARVNEQLAEAAEEKRQMDGRVPPVAPGLRLPFSDGVFMLDVYQGKSELVALVQSEADLNKNTGRNILRGVLNPVSSSRQTIELKGPQARIQSHAAVPVFFFRTRTADIQTNSTPDTAKDRFRIVRCENRKGNRILTVYSIAVYGKVKQQTQYVEIRQETVSDYWEKITPAAPLQPGEYALVEVDEKGSMNLFVRDFGVNPEAPQNPVIEVENPDRSAPVLIQKPQKKANP